MGASQSSIKKKSLIVVSVNENSPCFSHLSPFIHAIVKYNTFDIKSEEDIQRMSSAKQLCLEILDLRNYQKKDIEVSTPLKISVVLGDIKLNAMKVLEVLENSPAEGKVAVDDFIIGIEGSYLESNDDFFHFVYKHRGEILNFVVYRNCKVRRVPIAIGISEPFLGTVLGEGLLMLPEADGEVTNIGTHEKFPFSILQQNDKVPCVEVLPKNLPTETLNNNVDLEKTVESLDGKVCEKEKEIIQRNINNTKQKIVDFPIEVGDKDGNILTVGSICTENVLEVDENINLKNVVNSNLDTKIDSISESLEEKKHIEGFNSETINTNLNPESGLDRESLGQKNASGSFKDIGFDSNINPSLMSNDMVLEDSLKNNIEHNIEECIKTINLNSEDVSQGINGPSQENAFLNVEKNTEQSDKNELDIDVGEEISINGYLVGDKSKLLEALKTNDPDQNLDEGLNEMNI